MVPVLPGFGLKVFGLSSPLLHGRCQAVVDDEVGDEGHLAGGANGDELVTLGKRSGTADGTVFGQYLRAVAYGQKFCLAESGVLVV